MNIAKILAISILIPAAVCPASRQLEKSEISAILKSLTEQVHTTWIPAGTITATHEEFKIQTPKDPNHIEKQTEFKLLTNATVCFDGERFNWRIDAVRSAYAEQSQQFDFSTNGSRVFVWDGQRYSTYYRPVNISIIKDAEKLKIPHAVNGPLTAGLIPWGFGNYSYEKLSSAQSWATESVPGNQREIQLALNFPNGTEILFSLDPEKDYAVLSQQIRKADNSIALNTYANFQLYGNRWVPKSLILEQYKNSIAPNNLIASDTWNFTSITDNMPAADSFRIDYEKDALIEYHTQLAPKSVMYHYSKNLEEDGIDSDALLIEKFDFDAQAGSSHNCASAAIKYALVRLGTNIDKEQLSRIPQNTNGTSLYAIKQFIQTLGLYCRAVKIDITSLKNLSSCQAILHIPGKNHYVVLGNIDDAYVRVIDLSDRKFLDRFSISDFTQEWAHGTALLISDRPINLEMTDIDDSTLQGIFGAGYSCSKLLQNEGVFYCDEPIWGSCGGTYAEYMERWGCAPAATGTCSMSLMPRYHETVCVVDIHAPGNCTVTGEWKVYYMRACR